MVAEIQQKCIIRSSDVGNCEEINQKIVKVVKDMLIYLKFNIAQHHTGLTYLFIYR